jgi:hypothetical protein
MKRLFMFFPLIIVFFIYGFSSGDGKQISDFSNDDWKLYETVNGVEIYYKSEECHDINKGMHKEHVLLKFVNTTEQVVLVNWNNHLWYDEKCLTCVEDPEHKFSLTLQPAESKEGGCDENSDITLKVFSRFLNYTDKPELTTFELSDLKTITK